LHNLAQLKLLAACQDRQELSVADLNEVEQALSAAIKKRMLEGCGTLSKVGVIDGIVQVTFSGVKDDTHVFDTLSGALLDLRLELDIVPDLDVKNSAHVALNAAALRRLDILRPRNNGTCSLFGPRILCRRPSTHCQTVHLRPDLD
jgi:hypothetical protein